MATWFVWEPRAIAFDLDPLAGDWACVIRMDSDEPAEAVTMAREILTLAGRLIAEIGARGSDRGTVHTIEGWCDENLRGYLRKSEREARQKAIAAGFMTAKVPR